ncbi:MAG: helix-turn-helix domain-containing protein [Bacteroidia bacterium]|jgi:excisionase family DNA binding protein|nr:helix-turn-helix domain-containing protein [Bacteroidia bacterium]
MEKLTLETLPQAVGIIYDKLTAIERILVEQNPPQHAENEQLLTIQQAGEFLNLSVPTIYGYVSRSAIPVSKRGKRLYFSKLELLQWIKDGRKKTAAEIKSEAESYIKRHKKG